MGNMLGGIWWELQGEMGELSLKTQYVYSWNLQRITKNTVRKTIQLGGKRSIVIYQCLDSGSYLLILFLCKQWKLLIMKNPVPGSFPFTFYVIRHYSSFQWAGEKGLILWVRVCHWGKPQQELKAGAWHRPKEKCFWLCFQAPSQPLSHLTQSHRPKAGTRHAHKSVGWKQFCCPDILFLGDSRLVPHWQLKETMTPV